MIWAPWSWDVSVSWQAVGALATTGGTFAALYIASSGRSERQKELHAEYLSEARLIRIEEARLDPIPNPTDSDVRHFMIWRVANAGHEPVFDVHCEAWTSADATKGPAQSGAFEGVFLPNPTKHHKFRAPVGGGDQVSLSAWQVRWTDRHGIQWRRDSIQDKVPRKYDGTPPRKA